MSVIIGIDPPEARAACAIDQTETLLAELQIRTGGASVTAQ